MPRIRLFVQRVVNAVASLTVMMPFRKNLDLP
jgi:hypothetical protein